MGCGHVIEWADDKEFKEKCYCKGGRVKHYTHEAWADPDEWDELKNLEFYDRSRRRH